MINCNPETVSTDYDTSDRLYFEPLTLEDVLAVIELEQPEGVIVQFGGQTPLRLAAGLERAGVRAARHERRRDRRRRGPRALRRAARATRLPGAAVRHRAHRRGGARGGRRGRLPAARAPELRARRPRDGDRLLARGPRRLPRAHAPAADGREIFLDRFLENAIEVDVDALCDGERGVDRRHHAARRGGRHPLRRLGLRAAAALPRRGDARAHPRADARDRARARRRRAAQRPVRGRAGGAELYVIEANPRASRTVPFVSKAIGLPLAKLACRVMLGEPIAALGLPADPMGGRYVAVKEAVLPVQPLLRRRLAARPRDALDRRGDGHRDATSRPRSPRRRPPPAPRCPTSGTVFITRHRHRQGGGRGIAAQLHDLGFRIVATSGTAQAIERMGVPVTTLRKVAEGSPHVVDCDRGRRGRPRINTPTGSGRARTAGRSAAPRWLAASPASRRSRAARRRRAR